MTTRHKESKMQTTSKFIPILVLFLQISASYGANSPKREVTPNVKFNSITRSNSTGVPLLTFDTDDWRDEDLTDDLANYVAPLEIQKKFSYYLAGYDENNLPILVAEFGKMDLRGTIEQGVEAQAELFKYAKQVSYRITQMWKKYSTPEQPIDEFVCLIDFEGFQYRQLASLPTFTFLLKLAQTFSKMTAKHMAAGYVINADYLTHQLIRAIKPVFGRVISKVEVFGTRKSSWLPVVKRALGSHNLPEWYGGTSKDYKPLAVYGR